LTNHVNNKCEEKNKKQFVAIIDFDRFKQYIKLLVNNWDQYKQEYKFIATLLEWDSNKPKLRISYSSTKMYVYHIYNNSSRCKVLNILNKKHTVPMNLLMDPNSYEMFTNNIELINTINDSLDFEADLLADEFRELIQESDDEYDEDENIEDILNETVNEDNDDEDDEDDDDEDDEDEYYNM
jgi:hypothetical protein